MVPQVALSSEEVGPSDSEVRDSRLPPVATSHREGGSRFRSAEPTSLPPMRPPAMLRRAAAALALALGILAAAPASAFYLPGVAPNDFHKVPLPSPPPHLLVLLYVPSAPGLDGCLFPFGLRVVGSVRDLGFLCWLLLLWSGE